MCAPTISGASLSVISSPALADGAERSGLPDGQMIDLFGQVRAPVSRSRARPEANKLGGKTLKGISGLIGGASSFNARLARSLVSKLPRQEIGSMKSAMTWKLWVTPSGRQFSRLSVSVQTISDLGFTLRATPTATANQSAPSMMKHPGCRGLEVSSGAWCSRMGYPIMWLSCAPSGTRSSRKSRPSSSAHAADVSHSAGEGER